LPGHLPYPEAGENREIDLTMTVPADIGSDANVQTAMLFVTQMNPVDGVDAQGAAIRISVRQGIKIYRKGNAPEVKKSRYRKPGIRQREQFAGTDFQ